MLLPEEKEHRRLQASYGSTEEAGDRIIRHIQGTFKALTRFVVDEGQHVLLPGKAGAADCGPHTHLLARGPMTGPNACRALSPGQCQ